MYSMRKILVTLPAVIPQHKKQCECVSIYIRAGTMHRRNQRHKYVDVNNLRRRVAPYGEYVEVVGPTEAENINNNGGSM